MNRAHLFLATGAVCALSSVGFAAGTSAATLSGGLEGTWNYVKIECLSGAPYSGFGQIGDSSLSGKAIFTADQLNFAMNLSFKYKPGYAEPKIKEAQDLIQKLEGMPDSPNKQKSIADLKAAIATLQLYASGLNCQFSSKYAYVADGKFVQTTLMGASVTNCPGATSDEHQPTKSQYTLSRNVLQVMADKVETKDNSSCPKGDRTVTTFVKAP